MKTDQYVLGFAFSPDLENVALIVKEKPDWQKGFLNGIGGKIEDFDEGPYAAMVREFEEETGHRLKTPGPNEPWHNIGSINGPGYIVHLFAGIDTADLKTLTSPTNEQVHRCSVMSLMMGLRLTTTNADLLNSAVYLLPAARAYWLEPNFQSITLNYAKDLEAKY